MKIALLATLMFTSQAFAYANKTYECQNVDGLPKNTYKVETISVQPSVSLPYLDIHRFFHKVPGDVNSQVVESHMRGYAAEIQLKPGTTMLQLAAIKLEFDGDRLLNCRE